MNNYQEMNMKFFVREWSEGTIVLMTEMGHVLAYFSSTIEALKACDEWYKYNGIEKKQDVTVQYLKPDMNYQNITMI
jgi:hypothetical protein